MLNNNVQTKEKTIQIYAATGFFNLFGFHNNRNRLIAFTYVHFTLIHFFFFYYYLNVFFVLQNWKCFCLPFVARKSFIVIGGRWLIQMTILLRQFWFRLWRQSTTSGLSKWKRCMCSQLSNTSRTYFALTFFWLNLAVIGSAEKKKPINFLYIKIHIQRQFQTGTSSNKNQFSPDKQVKAERITSYH